MEPFRREQEAHARAWGDLKRKERSAAAAAAEDDSLKPAISLTRVDSDTLKASRSFVSRGAPRTQGGGIRGGCSWYSTTWEKPKTPCKSGLHDIQMEEKGGGGIS